MFKISLRLGNSVSSINDMEVPRILLKNEIEGSRLKKKMDISAFRNFILTNYEPSQSQEVGGPALLRFVKTNFHPPMTAQGLKKAMKEIGLPAFDKPTLRRVYPLRKLDDNIQSLGGIDEYLMTNPIEVITERRDHLLRIKNRNEERTLLIQQIAELQGRLIALGSSPEDPQR